MTLEPSAWRTGDAVRFNVAREAWRTATAALFQLADGGALELSEAASEARALRADFLRVDGFDRIAVEDFIAATEQRILAMRAGEG